MPTVTGKVVPGGAFDVVDSDAIEDKSNLKAPTAIVWTLAGALMTGQKVIRFLAPFAVTLTKMRLVINTGPTGANLIVDIHTGTGAGTTIFTTQGNRPTITDGSLTGVSVAPDVTAIAEAVEFSVYVDQIGSTIAGSDLTIILVGTKTVAIT